MRELLFQGLQGWPLCIVVFTQAYFLHFPRKAKKKDTNRSLFKSQDPISPKVNVNLSLWLAPF